MEKQIKFMSYNVWSREDVAVYRRMKAIGELVQEHSPDVIFLQEITPYIHSIFESFPWWKDYHCSPVPPAPEEKPHFCLMLSKFPLENYACWSFSKTATGRGYLEAEINPEPSVKRKPIRIATTQLECPNPPASMHLMERYVQAKHAVSALSSAENVVFGGDMNWDDNADMPFPLPAGWIDAFTELRQSEYDSWTYDSFWAQKAGETNGCIPFHAAMRDRSDRFVCKLKDYSVKTFQIIGDEAIVIGYKRKYFETYGLLYIDIMPSCHRGLVLTIAPNGPS